MEKGRTIMKMNVNICEYMLIFESVKDEMELLISNCNMLRLEYQVTMSGNDVVVYGNILETKYLLNILSKRYHLIIH